MSVRRLHLEQPDTFEWSPESKAKAEFWLAKYPKDRKRSAIIPLLWIAQKQVGGWLPEPAIRQVAEDCGMAYIRALEVATFYTMFNLKPVGRHFVQLCGTTPCMLRGAEDLKKVCREKIGAPLAIGADGQLSWLEVECLGACVNAPMVQISNDDGDHYYEDLTPETFAALLDDLAAGKPVEPGPQGVDRHHSEPEGGTDVLTEASLYDGSAAKPIAELPNSKPEPEDAPAS